MIDVELIKSRINCLDFLSRKGIELKDGGRCISPLRNGAKNKTSFICYEDWFYDFGQSLGGDCIDLCAFMNHNGDRGKAIKELASLVGIDDDGSSEAWKDYTQNLCNQIAKWHSDLPEEYREYCRKRGITDKTIDKYMIGMSPDKRLVIPYFKNGYVAYYASRAMPGCTDPNSKYKKAKLDGLNENVIFGTESIGDCKDTLIVAEGMFDCLSFIQEGYPTISAITGPFSSKQLPQALRIAKTFERVFLIYDNDVITKAGERFTEKMAKILFTHNIPFVVGQVPPGYKDVSEYYQAGGKLQNLVENSVEGVESLCSMLNEQTEFEDVVRKACRYMTKSDVAMLFGKFERLAKWDPNWLKVLEKECSTAPSEDSIVKEIVKKYTLKFHRSVGFVEYNGKFWENVTDETVMGYIGDALGVYRTGNKLSSILKVVKSEVNSNELLELNRHAIVNFLNGTLELEPKIVLREHSKDDFCTYCLPYTYDPNAKSEIWQQYLETVTDYDDKKIALMQEWGGYGLFTDCSLHKAFALIGEGRNGKSIYVNTIMDVYGRSNISTVSMSDLVKDFHSIDLKYSILNIASETRSDVTGAEEKFKKVTVGEVIRDAYKGKDVTEFAPRAKWFLNCNNFVTSKTDQSDGWVERFCFCEFKLRFCDEPRLPNERLADRTLEERLKAPEQLSAIFNWCLEGYKILKATRKFTEPDDQRQTKEDFIEITNPLVVFVKEFDIKKCADKMITNDDIYKNYSQWSAECNHKPLSKTQFSKRLPKIMREYRADLEQYRSGTIRGWRECKTEIALF